MTNFETATKRYCTMVNEVLESLIKCRDIPSGLSEAMYYSVESGGKRLRPAMLLAATEMFGGDMTAASRFAAALEMIHTYSLIHDDLPCMDDDDMRRARPSNHKAFGEGTAVLAGDALLTYAFEEILCLCAESNSPNYILAGKKIAFCAGPCGMVAGQYFDITNSLSSNEESLMRIHALKTGALFDAAIAAGCLIANADKKELRAMGDFAAHFGILFQITDDILDSTGSAQKLGKAVNKDADMNKLTFTTLFGVERARERAKHEAELAYYALDSLKEIRRDSAYFRGLVSFCLNRDN